jgi:hypothetical protein
LIDSIEHTFLLDFIFEDISLRAGYLEKEGQLNMAYAPSLFHSLRVVQGFHIVLDITSTPLPLPRTCTEHAEYKQIRNSSHLRFKGKRRKVMRIKEKGERDKER